jgi:hypothetical protein
MALPECIRVRYEPEFHTRYIGGYDDDTKQFMAFVVAAFAPPPPDDWQARKRWYSVLHTFDDHGAHLGTSAWFAGTTGDGEGKVCERAHEKLLEMIGGLGAHELSDVWVRPFQTVIDGHRFGLVDTTDEERGESYTLWPNNFFFTPPWDGTYCT